MRRRNEYDAIYMQDGNIGLEYVYKNHRLSGEKIIPPKEFSKSGIYMNFAHGISGIASGKWFCPECGTFVKETTVNRYIGELEPKVDEDDNDYDEYY